LLLFFLRWLRKKLNSVVVNWFWLVSKLNVCFVSWLLTYLFGRVGVCPIAISSLMDLFFQLLIINEWSSSGGIIDEGKPRTLSTSSPTWTTSISTRDMANKQYLILRNVDVHNRESYDWSSRQFLLENFVSEISDKN
jgi:hypothetical protein